MDSDELIKRELKRILQGSRCHPFLFVGSGISIRYAHTRSWVDLLKWMCNSILDEFAYARFYNEAKAAVGRGEASALLPYLATLAESPINNTLLQDRRFEMFRARNRDRIDEGVSPMKLFIADDLNAIKIDKNDEVDILRRRCASKLAGIITTNYDFLCESLFPEFDVYIGERELLLKEPSYSAEIFKIHGSASRPDTMVLTQADYNDLQERREYLAAKILTLFLEYPIIFLGYSLQDEDINAILSSIARCLGSNGLNQVTNRMIFVSYGDPLNRPISSIARQFGADSLNMTQITTRNFTPVFEAIAEMDQLYDPKLVRRLRKSIVSIASHIEPSSEFVTSGFSQLDNLRHNDRVVIAFSPVEEGFGRMVSAEDLYYDAVFDDREFNSDTVVVDYLPRLLRNNAGGLPIFKYLANYSRDSIDARIDEEMQNRKTMADYLNKGIIQTSKGWRDQLSSYDIQGLVETFGFEKAHTRLAALRDNEIDAEELRRHLTDLISRNGGMSYIEGNSELKRAIRILDLLAYKAAQNEKPLHLSPKCEHPVTSEEVDHIA